MNHDEAIGIVIVLGAVALVVVDWLLRKRSTRLNGEGRCGRCGALLSPEASEEIPSGLIAKHSYETMLACKRCAARIFGLSKATFAMIVIGAAITVATVAIAKWY